WCCVVINREGMVDLVSRPHKELGGLGELDQGNQTMHWLTGCGEVPACDAAVVEAFQKDVLRSLFNEAVAGTARVNHSVSAFCQVLSEFSVAGEELGSDEVRGDPARKVCRTGEESFH